MTIESAYSVIYNFLVAHQLVALGILLVLAIILWKKPAVFYRIAIAALIVIVVFYVLTLFIGSLESSVKHEKQMIYETESKMSTE